PFALDKFEFFARFKPLMYAWVRFAPGHGPSGATKVVDIDLLDAQGGVCARMRGLSFRTLDEGAKVVQAGSSSVLNTLLPVWSPRKTDPLQDSHWGAMYPSADQDILVFDAVGRVHSEIQNLYPKCKIISLQGSDSVEDIQQKISLLSIEHIVWVAPNGDSGFNDLGGVVRDQEQGVIQVFRIIKALIALGYGTRTLSWTVLTFGTLRVKNGEEVDPTHAGIHGLMGSLAKEYSHWNIRILDLPLQPEIPFVQIFNLVKNTGGATLAFRD